MGNELFKRVTDATGLPKDLVTQELTKLLSHKGIAKDEVTLDELRNALAEYVREVLSQAKDRFEDGVWIEEQIPPEDLGKE